MPRPKIRPDLYRPPDIAEWLKHNRREPFPLPPCPEFAAKARELIGLDACTLDAEPSFAIQDELTEICEAVLATHFAGTALCYFRETDGLFWAYPYETVKGTNAPIYYL